MFIQFLIKEVTHGVAFVLIRTWNTWNRENCWSREKNDKLFNIWVNSEHVKPNEWAEMSLWGTWILHLEYISGCWELSHPFPASLSETTADHTNVRRTGSSRVQLKLFALPRTADSVNLTAVCVCFPVSVQLDPGRPFIPLSLPAFSKTTNHDLLCVSHLGLQLKEKGKVISK